MYMESLEDDNFLEFKGGTLEINTENGVLSSDNEETNTIPLNHDKNNENVDKKLSGLSNLIAFPKRITETLLSYHNNNIFTRSITSNVGSTRTSEDDAQNYFTFRESVVTKAVQECIEKLNFEQGNDLISTFLLTEITSWDTEKERLVLLTNKAIFIIKYDFIAQKMIEHKNINLMNLDDIIIGDLVYPSASLVPDRKTRGIRLIWNNGAQQGSFQRWNFFTNEIPYVTLTSHPLFNHPDCCQDDQRDKFSMDSFCQQLVQKTERLNNEDESQCLIKHKEIVLSTYLGLGSLIYNRNSLGFFKVRGKFSF